MTVRYIDLITFTVIFSCIKQLKIHKALNCTASALVSYSGDVFVTLLGYLENFQT